ncbi:hypothetical protein A3B36_01260 [Candidatus Uhrbacteria bacterium RIFCSPLOWO2_01_FULL_55_36]|uniref:DUF2029 domain-containing protein n=1 Tax=Candidatus Uhrbacteria bacterium RIFCSPLOWO2_01_FULL_55_36 TaxID=1802404 RepID=A0A1F7V595_9BACT|nr:MAG: hypothetical protein A3B36_01260 [Candidatus Uhrbacteria bacterium RIFCSPLOWO2_01_FULL_55_36]
MRFLSKDLLKEPGLIIAARTRFSFLWMPIICFIMIGMATVLATPLSMTLAPRGIVPLWQDTPPSSLLRLLIDTREFKWYHEEGTWFLKGFLPYRDYPYEYPVLATALFTLPALFVSHPVFYQLLFRMMAVAAGAWLMYATLKECQRAGQARLMWLFLLPSVLYFTVNRFDVFPALALQLSLYVFIRGMHRRVWVWLAVSFLFKWYAGLLIPLYLVRTFDMVRNIGERRRAFGGLLLGVSIVLAGHLWLLPLGGSVLDAMNPYAIHFERPPEVGSLPAAVLALVSPAYRVFDPNDLPKGDLAVGVGALLSSILQLSGVALVAVWARKFSRAMMATDTGFACAAFFVVGCFVLFSRVYSQQWIVWLAPLFIFTNPAPALVGLFVVFDLVNYIQFPILFGTLSGADYFSLFTWLTIVRSLLLGLLIFMMMRVLRGQGGVESGASYTHTSSPS